MLQHVAAWLRKCKLLAWHGGRVWRGKLSYHGFDKDCLTRRCLGCDSAAHRKAWLPIVAACLLSCLATIAVTEMHLGDVSITAIQQIPGFSSFNPRYDTSREYWQGGGRRQTFEESQQNLRRRVWDLESLLSECKSALSRRKGTLRHVDERMRGTMQPGSDDIRGYSAVWNATGGWLEVELDGETFAGQRVGDEIRLTKYISELLEEEPRPELTEEMVEGVMELAKGMGEGQKRTGGVVSRSEVGEDESRGAQGHGVQEIKEDPFRRI